MSSQILNHYRHTALNVHGMREQVDRLHGLKRIAEYEWQQVASTFWDRNLYHSHANLQLFQCLIHLYGQFPGLAFVLLY